MEKNGAKGKHWQLKGSPLSAPTRAWDEILTHQQAVKNLFKIWNINYESQWPNQANRSSSFRISRVKVNKQQEKNGFRKKMLLQLSKTWSSFYKFDINLLCESPFLGISSHTELLFNSEGWIDGFVKSSPPASPPSNIPAHSQCLSPAPGKCSMTAGWATAAEMQGLHTKSREIRNIHI